MTEKLSRLLCLGIAFAVLASALALPATAAVGTAAQSAANETTTTVSTTASSSNSGCQPTASEPKLSQSRLYAPDKAVETGSPGRISGGFQVDPTSECPVVVYITMSVPSGMSIEGSSDIASSGAGMVTAKFTVRPGASVKDIAARVYSEDTGKRTVTADITYWPVGHKDMAREIDGLSFTFDVKEPVTPSQSQTQTADNGQTETAADDEGKELVIETPGFGIATALVAVLGGLFLFGRR